ncbi:MAG: hypothetical protein GY870_20845, partial [archaeon]|nr:hypothetical protein [archaeon]
NGLISLLLFALIVPIIYIRSKSSKERCEKPNRTIAFKQSGVMIQCMAVGYGAVFIIIALMVFSPWMIRNTIWTNNPVYPFYDHFFKYKIFNISDLQEKEKNKEIELNIKKSGAPINHFTLRKIVFKEAWWQTALIPVRIFFSGKDGTPKYFDGKLNPFLCILPIFAFIGIKKKNRITKIEKYVFIAFSILYLFIVFFQIDMRIRWIAPIIPPLVILSMYGLYEINTLLTKQKFLVKGLYREIVIIFIIGVILLPNFSYIVEQFKYVDPFSYISGKLKRSEYIEKYRPEYPVIRYANENLPTDAKIFSIFLGMRSYYSDRELIFFNSGSFLQTLKNVKSPKAIQHELEKTGITHIIVGYDLLDSWANQSLGLQEKELLVKFFKKQAKLIFSNGKYGLYEFL